MLEDDICRVAFADAFMVRQLLALLPDAAVAQLDLRRMRRFSTEHVGSAGQHRRAGMSWAVGMRHSFGEPAEALLALEFQSTPDRAMALRLAAYTALLLQETTVEGRLPADSLLPPLLPVVVYTGRARWRLATLSDLTVPVPPEWNAWQLRLGFHLLDAKALKAEHGRTNAAAALLRLLASRQPETLPAKAAALFDRLRREGRYGFTERLARALMGLLVVRFGGDETSDRHQRQLQRALRYMEEPSMLSLAIDEWREEALAQGRSEGRSEGIRQGRSEGIRQGVEREKALLQRVATRRFGVDLGDRIGALLAGEDDTERLAQVADLIGDCSDGEELLDGIRRLVDE